MLLYDLHKYKYGLHPSQISQWKGHLLAVMDWYSRYVLGWNLSSTLDSHFCVQALRESLQQGRPQIFNTDQGSQFTSQAFTKELEEREVQISMDGKGRVFDNIFIERLWRTVKYEQVYLVEYEQVRDIRRSLCSYFTFYNKQRWHQSLEYKTPYEVHFGHSCSV